MLRVLVYPLPSIFFLLLVLTPFQMVKDHYFNEGDKLSFWGKFKAFLVIFSIFYGIAFVVLLKAVWPVWYTNLIHPAVILGFSLIFPTILYWTVDRYEETTSRRL